VTGGGAQGCSSVATCWPALLPGITTRSFFMVACQSFTSGVKCPLEASIQLLAFCSTGLPIKYHEFVIQPLG